MILSFQNTAPNAWSSFLSPSSDGIPRCQGTGPYIRNQRRYRTFSSTIPQCCWRSPCHVLVILRCQDTGMLRPSMMHIPRGDRWEGKPSSSRQPLSKIILKYPCLSPLWYTEQPHPKNVRPIGADSASSLVLLSVIAGLPHVGAGTIKAKGLPHLTATQTSTVILNALAGPLHTKVCFLSCSGPTSSLLSMPTASRD